MLDVVKMCLTFCICALAHDLDIILNALTLLFSGHDVLFLTSDVGVHYLIKMIVS